MTSDNLSALIARGAWQPIETAPRDGTYILLRFVGPFLDQASPGVAVGTAATHGGGWWLTAIWASTTAHHAPTQWRHLDLPVEHHAGEHTTS